MNELQVLIDAIKGRAELDDDVFKDEVMTSLTANIDEQFSPTIVEQSINQIVRNLEEQGLTKAEAIEAIKSLKDTLNEMVYGEVQFTGNKKVLVDHVINKTYEIFDRATEKYHSYSIELPMVLAEGAKTPTYAHDTDAAADLYALEDTNLNAHTYGNLVRTGVKIQLPEGWLAFIMPRSGMSKNTPFRISNSVGLIDSGYRGELGVLLDNTSDTDSYIAAGTRIAQMLVMPSYRFQPKVVDVLTDSDRGETGFGASGNN